MGEGITTNQMVHYSAVDRMNQDPAYRPDNLVVYLQGHGAVVPCDQP
jgi:hypothetical protein